MSARRSPVPFVLAAAALGLALAAPVHAKPKPAPAAGPSPAPTASAAAAAPAPAPASSQEPLDRAIPRLEAKIKADPSDKTSTEQLAADYLQINRPDLALPLTQKLLQGGTKTAQVYFYDGFANRSLGRTKDALADYEQASNLEPTNAQILSSLTDMYIRLNRNSDAERVAKRAITFNKDDKSAYINYAYVLAAEQKYDEARTQLQIAEKIDPKDVSAIDFEARTYADQNAVALAGQTYDRALAVDPNNQDALVGRARVAAQGHDVKGAIGYFDRLLALQTDANDKATIVDLEAQVYAAEKMRSEAEATYKRAIADYPSALGAHVSYGDYLASQKDLTRAEQEWTAGLGTNRDNPDALSRLGELYAQQKQYPKAIDEFKRVTTVAPNDPRAYMALGQLYGTQKQYDRAHDAFRKAYEITRSPEALVGLGQSDYNTRNYNECAKIFEAFDRAAPDLVKQNPPILYVMGQCYANTNQKDKARSAYQRYLSYLKPDSAAASEVKKLITDLNRRPAPARPTAKK